jgi:Mce-associated membrane protein
MRSLLRRTPHAESLDVDVVEDAAEDDTITEAPEGDDDATDLDATVIDEDPASAAVAGRPTSHRRRRIAVFVVLPAVALVLALAAGALKWETGRLAANPSWSADSVRAATDGTIAILSYRPDTVEQDLGAARDRLTGDFLNDYTKLTHDVVMPGAKQKSITSQASVPAAASVTVSEGHAVVIVFIDQTTTIGADPPSTSASSVRVTLDKRAGRWLISGFDPV